MGGEVGDQNRVSKTAFLIVSMEMFCMVSEKFATGQRGSVTLTCNNFYIEIFYLRTMCFPKCHEVVQNHRFLQFEVESFLSP